MALNILSTKGSRFFILVIICIGIYLAIIYHNHSTPHQAMHYSSKSSIENQLKIDIQPIVLNHTQASTFKITLESTQNPDLSQLDLLESTLLTDDKNTPQKPIHWALQASDPFHQTGILTFPPLPPKSPSVSVTIFEYNDRVFTWNLIPVD